MVRDTVSDQDLALFYVSIGSFKGVINFREHEYYYICQNSPSEGDTSKVLSISHEKPSQAQELYGTLYRRGSDLVFESRQGEEETVMKHRVFGDLKTAEGSFISFRGLEAPVTGQLRTRLLARGVPLTAQVRSLLNRLEQREGEETVTGIEKYAEWRAQHPSKTIRYFLEPSYEEELSFEGLGKGFPGKEIAPIIDGLIDYIQTGSEHPSRAVRMFSGLVSSLSEKHQVNIVTALEQTSLHLPELPSQAEGIRQTTMNVYVADRNVRQHYDFLKEMIATFKISPRIKLLRFVANQIFYHQGISQLRIDFLAHIAKGLPREVIKRVGKESPPKLKKFLIAFQGGMPLVVEIYRVYQGVQDSEEFVKRAVDRAKYYLRGGRLFTRDRENLAFAYAALDNPLQLSFDQFVREVSLEDLPEPFLNENFIVQVPIVRAAHADIDKGILETAYQAIVKIHTPQLMQGFLQDVLSRLKKNGLKPFRAELQEILLRHHEEDEVPQSSEEMVTEDNAIPIALEIFTMMAHAKVLLPQARKVLLKLIIGLAATSEAGAHLIPTIAIYKGAKTSEQLLEVLNALREFYTDTVDTILQSQSKIAPFKFIEAIKKKLEQQAEKIEKKVDQNLKIEMVPSKSQTDAFAGYVAEDCTKERWKEEIKRPDTQIYRMIANERMEGMLYLKRDILDGKVVLTLGIEPRTRFLVDHKALLYRTKDMLGEMVGRYDYDYILISTSSGQRSNRPDMNLAIERQFTESIHFSDQITGRIFSGNSFLVVWERPTGLPKGPAPAPESQQAVSMSANTMMPSGVAQMTTPSGDEDE